jgi:hypothetical protein
VLVSVVAPYASQIHMHIRFWANFHELESDRWPPVPVVRGNILLQIRDTNSNVPQKTAGEMAYLTVDRALCN